MSPDPHVSIASFACTLSDLVILSKTTGQPETIIQWGDPVLLSVTIEFSGSGAISLLPLTPSIRVDFWAKSFHRREDLELGTVTLPTQAHQFTYTPAISLPNGLMPAGATPDQPYFLSALVRIGALGFPSLITGVIEGGMIQLYE